MAQRVIALLIDDLDGESEADETVVFGLDGASYEIDLTEQNAQALRAAVEAFVPAARTLGKSSTATPTRQRRNPAGTGDGPDLAAVRAWARETGVKVSNRGRVSGAVLQAYQDAH